MKLSILLLAVTAFAADPALFESRKVNVRSLLDRCEFASAAEQAKQLNREAADDVAVYQLVAAAELGLGNYEAAERSIQWMLDLRIGKADAFGWFLIARLREETGDLDGALEAANLAYARLVPGQAPDLRSMLVYSARLRIEAGKLNDAEQILLGALQTAQNDEVLLTQLAALRMAQQKRTEAAGILRGLIKPEAHPRVLYQFAQATGVPSDYAVFERKALERIGNADNANRQLVLYYAGPGKRPAEALKIARRETDRRHDILTLDALAVALNASGRAAEARTTMQRTLGVGTRDPEILKHARQMGVKPE